MAIDFIKLVKPADPAQYNLLIDYISSLRIAYERGRKCLDVMNHNQNGTVWTNIEALFGVPTGLGDDIYNLVNGSVGAMEGTFQNDDAKQITEQVG